MSMITRQLRRARVRQVAPVQLTFDDARKVEGHGGWRPGAGRPRGRRTLAHDERPDFPDRFPIHVTWRIARGVPSLRRNYIVGIIRRAILDSQREAFRIVEFSVQSNHIHFIIEANGKRVLASGMAGLARRLAVRLNAKLERTGGLFESRYHSRVLKSPREVRNALRYVLLNARHHAADRGEMLGARWLDPHSSGLWFDGWAEPIAADSRWKRDLLSQPRPTASAKTWLLAIGWRRWGALRIDEVPGV